MAGERRRVAIFTPCPIYRRAPGSAAAAAIGLASALVFAAAAGERPEGETLVKVARHAENHFVGVPCGILDQGVSVFGKNHLVFIDCRGPRFTTVPLPAGVHFWIFNTHTKYPLVDGLYATRHRECMEAAQVLGVARLADIPPHQLAGADAKCSPAAAKRVRHVVGKIGRVAAAVAAKRAGDLAAAGCLLSASHRSSRMLFENSTAELDFLVDALAAAAHVFGTRLTGGGFGGAVLAMTSGEFSNAHARRIDSAYAKEFGRDARGFARADRRWCGIDPRLTLS